MSRGHDFSERPLIAGSFVGVRSWRVNRIGVLTGVHAQEPWGIGENEARCVGSRAAIRQMNDSFRTMSFSAAQMSWVMGALSAAASGRVYLVKRPAPTPRPKPAPHSTGSLDCTCGFYAYFDLRNNPHHGPANVLGLIEGYGTMTIGARGFRASKARIVALIEPVPPAVRSCYKTLPPIFSTVAAALAEFPLSVPPALPQPEANEVYLQALRKRQQRNTGPARRVGLDGRKRG